MRRGGKYLEEEGEAEWGVLRAHLRLCSRTLARSKTCGQRLRVG
jgi:hypothetical protein